MSKLLDEGFNWLKFFFLMGAVVSIGVLVMLVVTHIDSTYDLKQCESTYKSEFSLERSSILECYANDDYWYINFGRNIDCSCYEFELVQSADFSYFNKYQAPTGTWSRLE